MRKISLLLISLFICLVSFAQTEEMVPQKFYYQNGVLSSEGFLRNGQPDGYWKAYYQNGNLMSEGNRKDFLLDSVWNFYDQNGNLQSEISYIKGKKHGISRNYTENYIQEINYRNDTIIGNALQIDYNGHLLGHIPFENGKENGWARFFDTLGNIHTIFLYENGYIIKREYINRFNVYGQKDGLWKTFNDSGFVVLEGFYKNGKKNGFFKYYDQNGNFSYIEKYENDILIENAIETKQLERKVDYHSNGKIKTVAHFFKGKPEGIRREYSPDGKVVKSYVFHDGIRVGEGIIDDDGKKQGDWKEFYESSNLRAKGKYKNGFPTGAWKYFYENGKIEISGTYTNKGKKDGEWIWFYPNGEVLSVENYDEGELHGHCFALSESGDTLLSGFYEDGYETGKWYSYNDSVRTQGKYQDGKKEGTWKTFYPNGKIKIVENYYNDVLDGKVIYYWENGAKKAEYPYNSGLLHGNAIQFDENGNTLYITTYNMGIETKYDGVKVTPTIDISFE